MIQSWVPLSESMKTAAVLTPLNPPWLLFVNLVYSRDASRAHNRLDYP